MRLRIPSLRRKARNRQAVRRRLEPEEQARLEEALSLDSDFNLAFANSASLLASRIWSGLSTPSD